MIEYAQYRVKFYCRLLNNAGIGIQSNVKLKCEGKYLKH